MKPDYDFVEEYVVRKANQRYGVEFDELKEEIQEALQEEANEMYEETKMDEAEALNDTIQDKKIDEFLETQAEAQQEIKNGWI
jgi:hypothetical protein